MTNIDASARKPHHGRNIKRFREIFGIKQEALALELGDDWSQKKVSRMEENEEIDGSILEQVAKILRVPVEAIKNFDEQAAIIYFNTFGEHSFTNGAFNATSCTFNPLDKIVELYEALLKSEREKLEIFQKILSK